MTAHAESHRPYVLVGMLDSPFVRRVAITMEIYGLAYTNLPLRTVGDQEKFAAYSPLKRAPTLVLPSGETLFDSHLILEHLDEISSTSASLRPVSLEERTRMRQVVGVSAGLADKAVSALYELIFHPPEARNERLLRRIVGQLEDSLSWLEDRAPEANFLLGKNLSHADVIVGTAIRFAREVHPTFIDWSRGAKVHAWCERLESMPAFQKTYLAVEPPTD
jgi:glutathione S-transferase